MNRPHAFDRAVQLRRCGRLVAVLLALGLSTSCDDSQSPLPGPADSTFRGLWDPHGSSLEFRIETPGGELSPLRLVASDIGFDPGTSRLHAQVAIRNAGSETLPGPGGILVDDFRPAWVKPVNAQPLRCPTPERCMGAWEFSHAGTYGADGLLSPGETSEPVEWIFADSTGESFSFRAALRPDTGTQSGVISGSVFADANGDGIRQPTEAGLAGEAVRLVHGDSAVATSTDAAGVFAFQVGSAGLYEVERLPSTDCQPTTSGSRQVFIVQRPDGTLSGASGIDFGCRSTVEGVRVLGIVFEDLDRDGLPGAGEPRIPRVLITGSTGCPEFAAVYTRTDGEGRYELVLPACRPPYVIAHEALPGFVDTTPNPRIFLGPVTPELRADFGVAPVDSLGESTVEGVVFEDLNLDGAQQDDERGLPGVTVTAQGLQCMLPVSGVTQTDVFGHYRLRQSDVHCALPWRVAHLAADGRCDTSPNPVDIGYDRQPDPRHYRVDFGVAPCDSSGATARLEVYVHWQDQALPGRRLEIVELHRVQWTNAAGLAFFTLPPGTYTLHAGVNTGGPPMGIDLTVTVRRGETTRVDVVDCLPCVLGSRGRP